MNIIAINRKPQTRPTTLCPLCRRPAQINGRIGLIREGRVTVWISCRACNFSGECDIDVPATGGAQP